MKYTDLLPTLGFLVIFPIWFRFIGHLLYRTSGWKQLAEHYRTDGITGRFDRIPRLIIGATTINGCMVRKEGKYIILRIGFPFRLFVPHPPLKIPVARINMKGRTKGTISVPGNGIQFEGFDPRKMI